MKTREKLEEVLDAADIRRQQYAQVASGDTPDQVIEELWEVYDEINHDEANLIAESYAIALKEVRENVITKDEGLMAMMIWEHALYDFGVKVWLQDREDADHGRDNALVLAPYFVRAVETIESWRGESKDWELIPKMMPFIMEKCNSLAEITPAKAAISAGQAHEQWKGEQDA